MKTLKSSVQQQLKEQQEHRARIDLTALTLCKEKKKRMKGHAGFRSGRRNPFSPPPSAVVVVVEDDTRFWHIRRTQYVQSFAFLAFLFLPSSSGHDTAKVEALSSVPTKGVKNSRYYCTT